MMLRLRLSRRLRTSSLPTTHATVGTGQVDTDQKLHATAQCPSPADHVTTEYVATSRHTRVCFSHNVQRRLRGF